MYILIQGAALLAESETLDEIKAIRDSYPAMVKAWLTIGEKKEMCKWYTVDYEGGCLECDITNEETSCCGDTGRCECEQLRQNELKAEAIDFKADADRENSC